jgi:mannose-1-phosphate guanylyltransferase
MKAIILADGRGLISEDKPKPKKFLNLLSTDTILQQTYQRFGNKSLLNNEKSKE